MSFSLDSNCMIALMSDDHAFHEATHAAYLKLAETGRPLFIASHSRLEVLSVLTRMPPPKRIHLETAMEFLLGAFPKARFVDPIASDYDNAIRSCLSARIAGGVLYDALIANIVHRHGAMQMLTWNAKHMKLVAPAGLEVLRPDQVLL